MKKIILFKFFTFFFSIQIALAQFGEIRGVVTDRNSGEPLTGATISYRVSGTLKGTITDENGSYKIKPLVAGVYDLEISFVTFHPQKINGVSVSAEKTTYIDVSLSPDNTLPVVEVTWERKLIDPGITSRMTVIDAQDLKHSVARDVRDHIASTPGVYQKEEGGSLNIRGSRDNATLYVVDGIRMHGNFSLPNSAIAEITVLTGGIPAQFGDATGGVVLITTKSYKRNGW